MPIGVLLAGIVAIVVIIALQIVIMVLGAVSGGLGCLAGLLFPFLLLAILVVHVICIVKGLRGERFMVPGLSEFADRFFGP